MASRGLRLVDPLSPTLFSLAVDMLSRLILGAGATVVIVGFLNGTEIQESLQFAGSTIFFSFRNEMCDENLVTVVDLFAKASGSKLRS